jgi:DNA-binding response OmpR family regulator
MRPLLAVLLVAAAARANAEATAPFMQREEIASPAGVGAVGASLARASDGMVWLSWVEPGAKGENTLRFSVLNAAAKKWSAPRTIVRDASVTASAMDFPQLAVGADGSVVAIWTDGHGGARISRSADRGATWSLPEAFTNDSDDVEKFSLTVLADGRVLVAWLDGRGKKTGSKMQALYARVLGENRPDTLIDNSVCDCCPTALAPFLDGGALVAYRDVARVLIVDDEPEIRQLLADCLRGPDLHVDSASSAKEALKLGLTHRPDLLVADLHLGDSSGLEVIDKLRIAVGDLPALVITGQREVNTLAEATRHRPVEVMTKPLDLAHLRECVRRELAGRAHRRRSERRTQRLRRLARGANLQRKDAQKQLDGTCSDLAQSYRALSEQLAVQQLQMTYQHDLLAAKCDDDVFRVLFRTYVRKSGPVFGIALVCDADAELQVVGRFGVPGPDSATFCQALVRPVISTVLQNPHIAQFDAGERVEEFDPAIRRYLAGVTVLAVPLLPASGEMIGLVVLYRKGEQPFTDNDVALAQVIAKPTALAVRRND